jgi:hypothetical protein
VLNIHNKPERSGNGSKIPSPLVGLSYHLCGVGTWPRIRRIGHPNRSVVALVNVADKWTTMICFASRLCTAPAAARDVPLWRYSSSMQMETGERRALWTRIGTPRALPRYRP